MRRGVLFFILMVIIGIVAGQSWGRWQLGPANTLPPNITPDQGLLASIQVSSGTAKNDELKLPQLEVVDATNFDFGSMEVDAKQSHLFVVRNVGQAPLKLNPLSTTCKCTVADVTKEGIPSGEQTEIRLDWTAKGRMGPFTQTATIETNDPRQQVLLLTVSGVLTSALRVTPSEMVFSTVKVHEPLTGEFHLLVYTQPELDEPKYEWQDAVLRKYFQVEFSPLSAEELFKDDKATAGLRGKITLLPGLPLGQFHQDLLLDIKLGTELKRQSISIVGNVIGEASLLGIGGQWTDENQLLTLGTVSSKTGASAAGPAILLRGDQREHLQLKTTDVQPDFLKVEFSTPEFMRDDNLTKIPLTLKIPSGSTPSRHYGSGQGRIGRVTIDTGIPNHPQLRFSVSFGVE